MTCAKSNKTGRAYVVCGPTAVGKGTVLNELRRRYSGELWYSVSATTRSPRPGEIDGTDYYFVSEARFDSLVASGGMLEWAIVHGKHRYGTPREPVAAALASGKIVILELDLAGSRQVRSSLPEATHIFIAPPSWEELERRLIQRGTEGEAEQARRLETAKTELAAQSEFDAVVVNCEVSKAVSELAQIMGLEAS